MKKRMLALVLAGVLSCNMGVTSFAADDILTVPSSDATSEIKSDDSSLIEEENVTKEETERTAQDGWVFKDGYWYYYQNGTAATSQLCTIDGKEYYFNHQGKMVTESFYHYDPVKGNAGYMVAESDGHVVRANSQWYKASDGYWYYYKADGWLASNEFLDINGKTYFFRLYGQLCIGAFSVNGKDYVTDANGAIVSNNKTGWVKSGNNWYYYKDSDTYAENEFLDIDGKRYYFNWEGIMQTGEIWVNNQAYLAGPSGVVARNQWIYHKSNWYYAADDYTLYSDGIYTIGNQKYVFDFNGTMKSGHISYYDRAARCYNYYLTDDNGAILQGKGWKYYNLHYYYSDADGKLYTDRWTEDKHYYLFDDGQMAVGTCTIDNKTYYFDNSGYCRENLSANFKGWKFVDGLWYYHDANGKPFTGWVSGTYYIQNGTMQTNCFVKDSGKIYYLDYDGKYVKNGWYQTEEDYGMMIFGGLVYANANGTLIEKGWQTINNKKYYFENYSPVSGAFEIDGKTELFDENSVYVSRAQKGWRKAAGFWYYVKPDGTLVKNTDTYEIGGNTFYFNWNGSLRCNEIITDSETGRLYYLDANGYTQTFKGWKNVDNTWYYVNSDGSIPDGLTYIGGSYYMFDEGRMEKGYLDVDEWEGRFFFGSSGAYQTPKNGWVSTGECWYYFVDGKPIIDKVCTINGTTYRFDYYGEMVVGPYEDFLFSSSGALLRNAWCKMYGEWFYADESGRWVKNQRTIGNTTYWFSYYGTLIK